MKAESAPSPPQREDRVQSPIAPPPGASPRYWLVRAIPVLIAPAVIAACIVVESQNHTAYFVKSFEERLALLVAASAFGAALTIVLIRRGLLNVLLCIASAAVLLREIHYDWTTWFIFVAFAALCTIAHLKRNQLRPLLKQRPIMCTWLIATVMTYVLSQLIARRFFQHIFGDDSAVSSLLEIELNASGFYGHIEEYLEVTAHVMLLVTVLIAGLRAPEDSSSSVGDPISSDAGEAEPAG